MLDLRAVKANSVTYLQVFCVLLMLNTQINEQIKSVHCQESAKTTLVVSQNSNGDGIRVVDQNTNKQVIDTSNQLTDDEESEDENEEEVVRGLLEWLENKKKKKKEKKKRKRRPQPLIKPEKKEIHIHINNHIKKKEHKHTHSKHKKHGGYEDYHDGHDDHDYHDKHYHGKHSWPLLGHHYNWDYYGHGGGGGGGHHDDHHGDDYGYESKKVESKYEMEKKPNLAVVVQRPVLLKKTKAPKQKP